MVVQGAINVTNLADSITQALNIYGAFTRQEILDISEEVAKDAAKELETAGNFKDRTGDYRKGWEAIKTDRAWIVRNKTDYQLTHLLEKGHAKRNGGRTKKYVHIKPVERTAIEDFEAKLRSRL